MKKLCLLLLLVISMTLMGCATTNDDKDMDDTGNDTEGTDTGDMTTDDMSKWKDGSYTGEGDPWEYGSEDSTVVVKDGRMTEITLRRYDNEGAEVDYELWTGQEIDGKTYPDLKQYREDMANKMIEAQSTEVDSIAGATVSCDNWKLATKRALDKAK
ncbi:FMN-binding protein [Vallitalea pronyensis]|uniref:FMN-binding protein n=1 Tax=Vallitalea pronyensis TaxID=1348613 RepID=A0A8J8MKT0_9FIRM|nr:FMN-binding protein [Vallitalea pronyensis]QUI23570.1 FMN-binding protein [Vallitalea pronyensis]